MIKLQSIGEAERAISPEQIETIKQNIGKISLLGLLIAIPVVVFPTVKNVVIGILAGIFVYNKIQDLEVKSAAKVD